MLHLWDAGSRIPWCCLPWNTANVTHLDPLHGYITACHSTVQEWQSLKSQPWTYTGLSTFSLSEKREKICGCRENLPQVTICRRQSNVGCILPRRFRHAVPVQWRRCARLGAPALQLGCTRLWCLSTLYILRNWKGSKQKQFTFSKSHSSWTFELWALVSYLPVILHIIAKKNLEVLQERKSAWAMASACVAQARRTWALFKHQLQFDRLEKSWLLESLYAGCPCKCFYQVALSFS